MKLREDKMKIKMEVPVKRNIKFISLTVKDIGHEIKLEDGRKFRTFFDIDGYDKVIIDGKKYEVDFRNFLLK